MVGSRSSVAKDADEKGVGPAKFLVAVNGSYIDSGPAHERTKWDFFRLFIGASSRYKFRDFDQMDGCDWWRKRA